MRPLENRISTVAAVVAAILVGGCERPSGVASADAAATQDASDESPEDPPPISPEREGYRAIWGTSDSDIWAAGLPIVGDGGGGDGGGEKCEPDAGFEQVVRHSDGKTWSRVDFGQTGLIQDIHGSASDDVWMVGTNGAVIRYDGRVWTRHDVWSVALPAPPVFGCPEVSLSGVWARTRDDVWVVGYVSPGSPSRPGLILHFDGAGWTRFPVDAPDGFFAVWASAANDVWATGSSGIAYHFDGTTWTRSSPATSFYLFSVWGSSSDDVWAAGNGGALTHFDGSSWRAYPDAGTTGGHGTLSGRSRNDVWAAFEVFNGDAGDARRLLHWDGAAWTLVPFTADLYIHDLWVSPLGHVWSAGTRLERIR